MQQKMPQTIARAVKPSDPVRTPQGHPAVVVTVHMQGAEATVLRLYDGELVRFRTSRLVFVGPVI